MTELNELHKQFQEILDLQMLATFYSGLLPSTARQSAAEPLTHEHMVAMLDRLNTLYDRERGDMPDKRFVINNGDYHGLVNKVVKRGDNLRFVTATGEFDDTLEGVKLFVIDLNKLKEATQSAFKRPELKFETLPSDTDSMRIRASLRWGGYPNAYPSYTMPLVAEGYSTAPYQPKRRPQGKIRFKNFFYGGSDGNRMIARPRDTGLIIDRDIYRRTLTVQLDPRLGGITFTITEMGDGAEWERITR